MKNQQETQFWSRDSGIVTPPLERISTEILETDLEIFFQNSLQYPLYAFLVTNNIFISFYILKYPLSLVEKIKLIIFERSFLIFILGSLWLFFLISFLIRLENSFLYE